MSRTKPNEVITVFPGSGTKHEVFITTAPVMIDQETDPQAYEGLPFYSPSKVPTGITNLSDLIKYCRYSEHECAVICNQAEFTDGYVSMIKNAEMGSNWRLYGM